MEENKNNITNKSRLQLKFSAGRAKQLIESARAKQIVIISHVNSQNQRIKEKTAIEEKDEDTELLKQIKEFTEYLQELKKKFIRTFANNNSIAIWEEIIKELKISKNNIQDLLKDYMKVHRIRADSSALNENITGYLSKEK